MAEETEQVQSRTFSAGTKIDNRYEIISKLGAGGFATVYKARHLLIDRDVALKIMDLQKCESDENFTERFLREAKIAGKLHHPNVVTIHDFGFVSETNQPYIAMELLEGYDLDHELLQNGPLSPNRAFALLLPVLEALGEGHRMGIVHKDLKPANLFLTEPGTPHEQLKILDFGVARMESAQASKLTAAGQIMGTPRYLAPEYIQSHIVTPALDVYQMGLIIAEALTAKPVIDGPNPFTTVMLHCNGEYELPEFLDQGPVGDVFHKALCIDYKERFQNCEEFAEALVTVAEFFESTTPITGGKEQPAHALSIAQRVSGHAFAKIPGSRSITGSISAQNHPQRKNILLLCLLAALVVIAIVVVVAVLPKEEVTTEPSPTPPQTEQEPPSLPQAVNYTFSSEPNGALVRNVRTDSVICPSTPCEYSYEGPWPLEVEFVKNHFETKEVSLNEDSRKLVFVTLDLKPLTFKFETDPPGANVKSTDGSVVYCETTPCIHRFPPPWPVKVSIILDGYNQETVELTPKMDSDIHLQLQKKVKREKQEKQKETGKETENNPSKDIHFFD